MKFRKKPVVIEAVQWWTHGDHPKVKPVFKCGPDDEHWEATTLTVQGWIPTLEGKMQVTPGDWIITGVKGEHYPCKPDIFALTYEPAGE